MLKIADNNQGAALVYLVGIILTMSVLGTAMLNLSTTSVVGHVSANHTDRAYFMAEAGLNYALHLVKTDIEADGIFDDEANDDTPTFILNKGSKDEGQFTIKIIDDPNETKIIITSTGSINLPGSSVLAKAHLSLSLDKLAGPPANNGAVVLSEGTQYYSTEL